jgi:singapore isolate B (sub-type 7) whole genome shotgun sequence assembly, scaffold_5
MGSDHSGSKTCFNIMNTILLIIACFVGGACWYIQKGSNVPPILETLSGYYNVFIVVAFCLGIVAIVGYFVSCGGCLLFLYVVAMDIVTVVCVIVTIVAFILFGLSKKVSI